jgi:hypothetical protein
MRGSIRCVVVRNVQRFGVVNCNACAPVDRPPVREKHHDVVLRDVVRPSGV